MRNVCLNIILLILWGGLATLPGASQCSPELDRLLVALQNAKTSNDAMQDLVQAPHDPQVGDCLTSRLPLLLDEYKPRNDGMPDFVWGNEARVAGELKIAEAAPVLARRIDMLTMGPLAGSLGYNFIDHAGVGALIHIGAPAVPVVIELLKHAKPLRREMAAHVLRYIGTSDSWQALEDALPGEKEPKVRQRIEEALKHRYDRK